MLTDLQFVLGESVYVFWIFFEIVRPVEWFARVTKKLVQRKAPDWFCGVEWLGNLKRIKEENREESM